MAWAWGVSCGWGAGLGRRRETGIRGRVFGLRLEGLEKLCIQGIEGWLNVE